MTAAAAGRRDASTEVLGELTTLHANMLVLMPWVQALLVAGVGWAIGPRAGSPAFLGWAGLTMAVETGRALFARRLRLRTKAAEPRQVHRRMVALALLSGACEGLAAVLLFPVLPVDDQAMLAVMLMTLPAGGAVVSMSSRYIIGAYAVGVLLPASVSWGLVHPHQQMGVFALCTLYCALLVVVAIQAERLLLRSLTIRHERDQMVHDLERSNTDARQAMARAEQAAQARARVLAAASHDLRQPLHALSIYSAILAARPTTETLQEVGQNIDQIVRSLGSLLTGLLDISKLSVGHYESHKQVFVLDPLLDNLCSEFSNAAAAKQLVLQRDLPSVAVLSDAMAVTRIVRNLLDNAIKYTDTGTVRVACSTEGTDALVRVSDSGKGILPAEQERVFEEFYQVDNPGRDRSKGVGLGLAIVQRLAELIGASITLQSAPGQGTCFTLRLPGAVAQSVQAVVPAPIAPAPVLAGRRVLLIDDEPDILQSMSTLLGLWQMPVAVASHAAQAHALMTASGPPALLIADLRLRGGLHGAGLAHQLQQQYGHFPVLIITGDTSSQALREATEAAYPILQKPITAETLHASIVALLAPPIHG